MFKKSIIITLAVLLVTGGMVIAQMPQADKPSLPPEPPAPCCGFGPGHGWGMGKGMMQQDGGMRCIEGMNLTDEQKKKINEMRLAHQREMVKFQNEMAGTQNNIKLMITADKLSKSEVKDLAGKIGAVHGKMVMNRINHMRQVRDILTHDQRVMFDQKILAGDHGPGFGKGMKRGRGHGKGQGRHRGW